MSMRAWAARWLRAAVTAGVVLSSPAAAADFDTGWAAFQQGMFAAAIAEWTPLAESGHPLAQYNLGVIYDSGLGVGRDLPAALRWWTAVAEAGLAEAQHNLALLYLELWEDGLVADGDVVARHWLQQAADGGFVRSQYMLGKMYADGVGTAPDPNRGFALIRQAGEAGLMQAQYNLGKMYRDGQGVAADAAEANRWWRQAAEQGYAKAQDHLAESYARGRGIARDEVAALAWSMVAARQGHPDSILRESQLTARLEPHAVALAREMSEAFGHSRIEPGRDDAMPGVQE